MPGHPGNPHLRKLSRHADSLRRRPAGGTFTVRAILDPAAHEGTARSGPGGTPAYCLVEPSKYEYFPAVISPDEDRPSRAAAHALVSIVLRDSEVRAFFAPGTRFTIWADAVVSHTVRARGLIGCGVISRSVTPPAPRVPRDDAAAGRACRARAPMPGSSGHAVRP